MDGRAWRELGARKFRGEVVEMRTRDLPVLGVARAASSLFVRMANQTLRPRRGEVHSHGKPILEFRVVSRLVEKIDR